MKQLIFKNFNRIKKLLVVVVLVTLVLPFCTFSTTKADAVTDTLSINVGYAGMDISEYVQVGKYYWYELMDLLPLYDEAYSFYQHGTFANQYRAIVDAARGFYLSDILDLANVYTGDIMNIMFYVEDASGIRSAFDYYSLFRTRYYFENMAGHRKVQYGTKEAKVQVGTKDITEIQNVPVLNEDGSQKMIEIPGDLLWNEDGTPKIDEATGEQMRGESTFEPVYEEKEVVIGTEPIYEVQTVTDYTKVLGYNFDECWNYCSVVPPMMAIEDNWASFTEDFENIGPDWSYASASSRFRLMFGQTEPTEMLTSKSDKYVSAIYITLYGKPEFGDITGDGTYGANTVEIDVSGVYNQEMTNQLSKYLNIKSTDEGVIVVKRIETISDSTYSDVSKVIVYYDVVGDGTASFTGGFGANDAGVNFSSQGTVVVKDGKATFKKSGDPEEETTGGTDPTKPVVPDEKDSDKKPDENGTKDPITSTDVIPDASVPDISQEINPEVVDINGKTLLYELSEDVAKELSGLKRVVVETPATQEITQVKTEDNTEEKAEKQRMILIFTGLGALAVLIIGGVAEYLSFKRRLKKSGFSIDFIRKKTG